MNEDDDSDYDDDLMRMMMLINDDDDESYEDDNKLIYRALPYRNCKASHALKSLYLHDISWLSYINEVYHLNISYYYQLRYNEVNNDESIMKNSTNNKW